MTPGSPALNGLRAWLISQTGPRAGVRYAVGDNVTRVGRGLDNDIVVEGPDAASVSVQHLEIRREGGSWRIRDLGSTNGTYLNGERIEEAELQAPAVIRIGMQGPEFSFVLDEPKPADLNQTMQIPEGAAPAAPPVEPPAPLSTTFDGLLSDAVVRAREARAGGISGQTITIMRAALHKAIRRSSRRFHLMIWVLVAGLLSVSGFAAWKIRGLGLQKTAIDRHIHDIETELARRNAAGPDADQLINQLDAYQGQAEELQRSVFYRVGVHPKEDFVASEIRRLLAEFGAEAYSVPPEFTDRVNLYIARYTGPDRPLLDRALGGGASRSQAVKDMLEGEHLPPDLAFIPVVESARDPGQGSAAGAAGPWQFTASTARALGLRVDGAVDERENLRKSTLAACHYLRNLILDFGSGSSVMLALAAYNSGPTKVKQAVMKTVQDPIKQRNFWYLYRVKALPEETREYVPKVFAVMIIGRNPEHFGF
jgi:hypothetical protein